MSGDVYSDNEIFNSLEGVMNDPVVTDTLNAVRDYQEIINSVEKYEAAELREIINDLDTRWPYTNESIRVTGWASFINTEHGTIERKWFEDAPMLSFGFAIESNESEVPRIVYALVYVDEVRDVQYSGVANIDNVNIEFPFASVEARIKRLQYFYPDTIDTIDEIVLGCSGEEDAVQKLAAMEISVNSSNAIPLFEDMSHYLDEMLEFDSGAPYAVNVDGSLFLIGEDDTVIPASAEGLEMLVYIKGVAFMQGVVHETPERFVPVLNAIFLSPDKHDKPRSITVPMRSITQLQSLRTFVYPNET